MAKNRLIGDYPVIGIRPTIDGRRGYLKVRESLEEQTMNMAKSAAKLFTDNLRYSNGEPVKVVIADTTIGRVGEAAACAEKFKKEGVAITLTVTPCWCYGAETMDMDEEFPCMSEGCRHNCYRPVLHASQNEVPDQSVLQYIRHKQMPICDNNRRHGH